MCRPRILVTGAGGQIGGSFVTTAQAAGFAPLPMPRTRLDLTQEGLIGQVLNDVNPDIVVNCAAYTAVDQAEKEPELACAINAIAPGLLAQWCNDNGRPLIQLSTDYIFSGAGNRPYREDDPIAPINTYGASKAEGERRVRDICQSHIILRTAWIYAAEGKNFVRTMLRLGAERDTIAVVADQRGCPTAASSVAAALCTVVKRLIDGDRTIFGTYHYVDAGETTWYDFAQQIFAEAAIRWGHRPTVTPITSDRYPTFATRPKYSVLDTRKFETTFAFTPRPWQENLSEMLATIL